MFKEIGKNAVSEQYDDCSNVGSDPWQSIAQSIYGIPESTKDAASAMPTGAEPSATPKPSEYLSRVDILGLMEAGQIGQDLFDQIDEDKNGFLSKKELAKTVSQKHFTGREAQTVAALYGHMDKLQLLSDDEWFEDDDGITAKDLTVFETVVQQLVALDKMDEWAEKRFDTFDKDGNGFLDIDEIDRGLEGNDLTKEDKHFLSHIKDNHYEMEHASDDEYFDDDDGVTRKDLEMFEKYWVERAPMTVVLDRTMRRTSESQTSGVVRDLYSSPLSNDIQQPISPEAIKQGSIGNCYLLASLAAVARQNPELIQKMIEKNDDGTYTVTFAGDPKNPVKVTAPTDSELGLYCGGSKFGTWACIVEKAYGLYQQNHGGKSKDLPPAEGGDGGGRLGPTVKFLTGKECTPVILKDTSESELAQQLQAAFCSKQEVTAGIPGEDRSTIDGFPTGHAYTILDFVPDGKGSGSVTVRNPWGGSKDSTDGTITIPLSKLKRNFSFLCIATPSCTT